MKKRLLAVAIAILFIGGAFGQVEGNTLPGSGNVGIGTNTPTSKLDV